MGTGVPAVPLSALYTPCLAICTPQSAPVYVHIRLQLHSRNRQQPYDVYYFCSLVSLADKLKLETM